MLSEKQVRETFAELNESRQAEKTRLDKIRRYLRDDPNRRLDSLPAAVPIEVQRLTKVARANVLKFAVNTRVQSMYVDGFRVPGSDAESPVWEAWQANGMDARQIGIHRAALSYGAAYATVLPGKRGSDAMPVIRGASPRKLSAFYGADDMWPTYALEDRGSERWRIIDRTHVYEFTTKDSDRPEGIKSSPHNAKYFGEPVCPVVRYRETIDLDDPVVGIVEPLIPLQDQINITTFGLLVAQHFGAFKFRYVLGWVAESEEKRIRASASNFFTLDESPNEVQIGQLDETPLDGYIESRGSALELFAAVSQTPAHELMGKLVQLTPEALAAAEAGKQRAILENRTVLGESHEQTLNLAGEYMGVDPVSSAYARWQDTEARSLAALVDALGKAVSSLGIPPMALWPRVADALGVSQQELESWKELAQNDPFAGLETFLSGQAQPAA